ncbi:MAG: hypothetical protein Q9183_005452 [Haloplaca sp. 2 TL-2023]
MSWFATGPGLEASHIVESLPSTNSQQTLVVDVGGSYGGICIALAQKYTSMRCIVQDKSDVVCIGRERLPHDLKDRVLFVEHDFFSIQPTKGADIYLLRWILHDWSDKYAAQILRALVPALKRSAKIVLGELVVPEPGTTSLFQERGVRAFDLAMLELHNGKERDEDEWINLFKLADSRFEVVRIFRPKGSRLSLIEAEWRGEGFDD